MPELPEVETVVRDLRPLVTGRKITAIVSPTKKLRLKWPRAANAAIVGQKMSAVRRQGKWIVVELSAGAALVGHLGMTGQLQVVPRDAELQKHTHFVFDFDNRTKLIYNDVRRFGGITYFNTLEAALGLVAEKLGPEPWDMPDDQWHAALKGSKRTLKAILLDQRIIAGVGNIYADESCFLAQVRPTRRAHTLNEQTRLRLLEAVRTVLTRSINSRGSTIRNYVGGSGLKGEFQNEFAAYGRDGEPCLTCGTTIALTRAAGRSTHYCPQCQR